LGRRRLVLYLIEKAFNLNNMSLEELKNFKKELTE
jgi:hypothetical protein